MQDKIKNRKNEVVRLDAHLMDLTKPIVEDSKGESYVFEVPCHACGK